MAIPKTEGRDEFYTLIDGLKPLIGSTYSREAALLTPDIDKHKLQMAVNKRTVYWPAIAALKKVADARKNPKQPA